MNVRNCRKCGTLFNYVTGAIVCPKCREEIDEKFKVVKLYIQNHPGVGIQETSRECEVEVGQIQQWIREERLEFAKDSMVMLNCESCGQPIRSGRYCDSCKNSLANGFRQATQRTMPKPSLNQPGRDKNTSPKMRFLDN